MTATTLVTVVFEAEKELLRLQARSLDQFWTDDSLAQIIVIDNAERPLSARWLRRLRNDYGRHRDRVQIVRANDLATSQDSGWMRQQLAKLAISTVIRTDAYLVLDAKNHLIAPFQATEIAGADGRWHLKRTDFRNHPLHHRVERVLDFLGLDRDLIDSPLPGTTTPYVFDTSEAQQLWAELSVSGNPAETFSRAELIEFVLYGMWLWREGRLDLSHDAVEIPCVTLWPKHRSARVIRDTLAQTDSAPFLAVHRSALARMSLAAAAELTRLWTDRGLCESRRAAWLLWLRARTQILRHAARQRLRQRN